MRLIDADELRNDWLQNGQNENVYDTNAFLESIDNAPTVDAVPVVRCHDCIMHDNCTTEDAFKLCGIEDPFCCAGKRREPVKPPEEEDSFLMNRFMRQE